MEIHIHTHIVRMSARCYIDQLNPHTTHNMHTHTHTQQLARVMISLDAHFTLSSLMQERLISVLYTSPHLCTAWLGSHKVNRHWWCYARHALVLHGPLVLSIKALAVLPHRFDKTMLAWQECESVTTKGSWVWLLPTWLHTIWASEWPSFVWRLINQSKWVNMSLGSQYAIDWI